MRTQRSYYGRVYTPFPAALEIDYPNGGLNGLTTLLRPILFIPIGVILALVSGPTAHGSPAHYDVGSQPGMFLVIRSGGVVVLPTVLMLLFRRKYPRWWFDWNLALTSIRDSMPGLPGALAGRVSID